jgi:hypothetical protein
MFIDFSIVGATDTLHSAFVAYRLSPYVACPDMMKQNEAVTLSHTWSQIVTC